MTSASKQVSVVVSRDGPYIVLGDATLSEEIVGANTGGESIKWQRGKAFDFSRKICALPLRPVVQGAILRWHPRAGRFRRDRNGAVMAAAADARTHPSAHWWACRRRGADPLA